MLLLLVCPPFSQSLFPPEYCVHTGVAVSSPFDAAYLTWHNHLMWHGRPGHGVIDKKKSPE